MVDFSEGCRAFRVVNMRVRYRIKVMRRLFEEDKGKSDEQRIM